MKATKEPLKYTMKYYSGGGTEYNGGIWTIRKTKNSHIFTLVEHPFFESNCPPRMIIRNEKERSHCLRDWEDGTFTVYPFQSGTPHVFVPLI